MGFNKNFKFIAFILSSVLIVVLLYALVFRVDFGAANNYQVQFSYIGTIMVGSPVRKSGVKVGSVNKIEINPVDQRTVFVGIALYDKQIIKQEDKVAIVSGGILGDQFIEIFPAPVDSPVLPPDSLIKGIESLDFRGLAVQGGTLLDELNTTALFVNTFLSRNSASLSKIIENTEVITNNLRGISEEGKRLGQILTVIEKEVTATSQTLQTTVQALAAKIDESLIKVDTESALAVRALEGGMRDFKVLSEQLKNMMTNLNKKDGLLGILQEPETANQIKNTLKNIQDISSDISSLTGDIREALVEKTPDEP